MFFVGWFIVKLNEFTSDLSPLTFKVQGGTFKVGSIL
jgi:hypothetical protein